MVTYDGRIVSTDDFAGPFRSIVAEVEVVIREYYDLLLPHCKAGWRERPLVIQVLNKRELNARANSCAGTDYIGVNIGTIEQLFGTMLELLSTPTFLPEIGHSKAETMPTRFIRTEFPRMPLLRSTGPVPVMNTVIPYDPTRRTIAHLMANLALEFLLYHEIGHIVGGHREWTRAEVYDQGGNAFQQILECDADTFAWDASSWIQIQEGVTDTLRELAPDAPWSKNELALILYFTAIGVLFRVLYVQNIVDVTRTGCEHPHPTVRAALISGYAFARAAATGTAPIMSVSKCMTTSIRNIEEAWADLLLPNRFPKSANNWPAEIGRHTNELFAEYRRYSPVLDTKARIARRWSKWTPKE